jgi:hypothetical protein
MNNTTLPTEELKKYGIINEDLSFSKKLNADDIQKFLKDIPLLQTTTKTGQLFSSRIIIPN